MILLILNKITVFCKKPGPCLGIGKKPVFVFINFYGKAKKKSKKKRELDAEKPRLANKIAKPQFIKLSGCVFTPSSDESGVGSL